MVRSQPWVHLQPRGFLARSAARSVVSVPLLLGRAQLSDYGEAARLRGQLPQQTALAGSCLVRTSYCTATRVAQPDSPDAARVWGLFCMQHTEACRFLTLAVRRHPVA